MSPAAVTPNGWRILIVDDDPLIVELLEVRLKSQGYLTRSATDGEKAYGAMKEFNPHLILCDVVMPNVDGPTFCRRVRADKNLIPFLFLTAKGQPRDKVEVLSAGADDYLVKPFEPGELFARIQAILRRFYPQPPQ